MPPASGLRHRRHRPAEPAPPTGLDRELEVHFRSSHRDSMTELTIGELSERSGVATSALRFYEDRGLIRSRRTTGNQRRYARATLRRVAFVRTAQRVGL